MARINGTCDPKYEALRGLFQQFVDSEEELGASFAVNVDGKDVVNLWGGYANADRTLPWKEDTIVNVFSTTKNISSLAVLMLVDSGDLSIHDKVSKYWPEFAANGKEDIEIRHLLSHTSGVAGWDDPMTSDDMCNLELSTAKLAGQAPWWTPGTASGYHCWTFGHLLGEVVRRITGLSLKEFVAQRIATPLGADFQIGALEKDWPRITNLIPPPPPPTAPKPDPTSVAAKIMNPIPDANFANTPTWRRAEIGAANGHTNAQALVRIFSSKITLAGKDGEDSKQSLSKKTVDQIFEQQSLGVDLGIGAQLRFGVGFGIRGNGELMADKLLPEGRIAFWGGWGGSVLIMDVDRKVTIGYTMNKMTNVGFGNSILQAYVKTVYKALDVDY